MILIEAWKNVVLNNYTNFEGRANRAEFWWFVLANLIAAVILAALGRVSSIFELLSAVYALGVLLPSIAVAMRRLHDTINQAGCSCSPLSHSSVASS